MASILISILLQLYIASLYFNAVVKHIISVLLCILTLMKNAKDSQLEAKEH